jgi:tryptophan synthase alpha chain
MSRLDATFAAIAASGRVGLVAYVTAGDPDLATSREIIRAIDEAGADVIELGVPFSDPIADGPVIQRASERALAAGANLRSVLDMAGDLRSSLRASLVLFTYVNPVMRMGVDAFVDRAAAAGIDGVLLLDLPIEESADMQGRLGRRDIDQIFLISPTTTDERLRVAAGLGRGFLYAISRLGVTGVRSTVSVSAKPIVDRIRAVTALPVALGFGISSPEHVREVGRFAHAAVVGSALVQTIGDAAVSGANPAARAGDFVRWLREG